MGCILEQQIFTGKLCCSPLTCLGSTGPCSCVKLCSLCLLLRKTALESIFCTIWHWVAASFCWCSCHPSAALYRASLLDKVSSALHLFLLRAFYVPSESIFWASDTFFWLLPQVLAALSIFILTCVNAWCRHPRGTGLIHHHVELLQRSFSRPVSVWRMWSRSAPYEHFSHLVLQQVHFLEITYPCGVFWFFLKNLLSFRSP